MARLPLIAHDPLVSAFDEEPIEVAEFLFESLLRGNGLAGSHAELLAPAFGLEVEGIQSFAVG